EPAGSCCGHPTCTAQSGFHVCVAWDGLASAFPAKTANRPSTSTDSMRRPGRVGAAPILAPCLAAVCCLDRIRVSKCAHPIEGNRTQVGMPYVHRMQVISQLGRWAETHSTGVPSSGVVGCFVRLPDYNGRAP